MVKQSGNGTSRCPECWDMVDGPADALKHWSANHPQSDHLREVLSEISIEQKCKRCGQVMASKVSVGLDASTWEAASIVPTVCDECVANEPLDGLMIRELSSKQVYDHSIQPGTGRSGGSNE